MNYTISLHSLRFREAIDAYHEKPVQRLFTGMTFGRSIAAALLSNLREHGNFLLLLLLLAIQAHIALWCIVVIGFSHWALAVRRLGSIAVRLASPTGVKEPETRV